MPESTEVWRAIRELDLVEAGENQPLGRFVQPRPTQAPLAEQLHAMDFELLNERVLHAMNPAGVFDPGRVFRMVPAEAHSIDSPPASS